MADLSEYLGHLLCEVTRARVMADHEAVRVALAYAADAEGLLRFFPVPRVRLPELEITVPVAVREIPDGYAETTAADMTAFAKALAAELGRTLAAQSLRIDTTEITRIITQDPLLSRGRLRDGVVDALTANVRDRTQPAQRSQARGAAPTLAAGSERFRAVTALIREQVARAVEALPRVPAGIAVEGRTAAVREVGDLAAVVSLKLVVREDALEIILADGSSPGAPAAPQISRLVPE